MPKFVLTKKYFDGSILHQKGKILTFSDEVQPPKGSLPYVKAPDAEPEEASAEELLLAQEKAKAEAKASKPIALSQIKAGDTPT